MDNLSGTGALVQNMDDQTPSSGGSHATAAELLIPKMDKYPILPDAGHFTDIVSTDDNVPWFDHAHPDIRPEVIERGCNR